MNWGRGKLSRYCVRWVLAALCPLAWQASPARADGFDLFSRETLHIYGDLRLVGADGERSWLDDGFGKARFGGAADGDFRIRPKAAEGALIWQPRLGWSLTGTVVGLAQNGQDNAVDLSEAYLTFKPKAAESGARLQARAGLFWPPVSLEHGGPEWSVTDTITPSAINSWIGEEVKMVGVEGRGSLPLAGGRLSLTAALFSYNTTAGALLGLRGWALHDEKAVAFGKLPLPPLNAFIQTVNPPFTQPVLRIGSRPGYYLGLGWAPAAPVRIEYLHYDNRSNPEAVNAYLLWGWRTHFDNIGAVANLGDAVELRAQAMAGRTSMGFPDPTALWVDTRFRSAYLLATHRFGEQTALSGRVEAFGTRNRGSEVVGDDDEDGWAATLAARHSLNPHMAVLVELLHVESDRDARLRSGLTPQQNQSVLQLALRAHF